MVKLVFRKKRKEEVLFYQILRYIKKFIVIKKDGIGIRIRKLNYWNRIDNLVI